MMKFCIKTKNLQSTIEWCNEVIGEKNYVVEICDFFNSTWNFYFKNPHHATIFKLKWV